MSLLCVSQVNPAVFTIVTFPFLFAVMFGDMGHGILMLLFALFMVLREKALGNVQNDMFEMLFGGRYVILLMSMFSIYTGLMYNEAFSMPMTIFGDTKWQCLDGDGFIQRTANGTVDNRICHGFPLNWTAGPPLDDPGKEPYGRMANSPYPFGFDPVWHGAKTELTFTNSLKMKMSIILGVIHMDLGIIMSLFNQMYFRDHLSIWCEFVPQFLFLNALFGYLCFMIIYKWTLNWTVVSEGKADLYNVMINMFLQPGTIMSAGRLYSYQGLVQVILVLVAVVSIPWMLLPKPLILRSKHLSGRQVRFWRISCTMGGTLASKWWCMIAQRAKNGVLLHGPFSVVIVCHCTCAGYLLCTVLTFGAGWLAAGEVSQWVWVGGQCRGCGGPGSPG